MLRLVAWNCHIGGFRYKAEHVACLRPDVLVVQEVEPLEQVVVFGGECQPTYRDRIGDPAFPKRAIGVFSYTGLAMRAVDLDAPLYAFRRYVASKAGLQFNAIATWTAATGSPATSYRQAHEGIEAHGDWIRERPTVLLGDLNDNASYKGTRSRQCRSQSRVDLLGGLFLQRRHRVAVGIQGDRTVGLWATDPPPKSPRLDWT